MSIALSSPSVSSMLGAVRRLLRQPDAANSQWTDEDLLSWMNDGVRIHFAELTGVDEGQFTVEASLDITANVDTISLPTDCYMVKGVWKKTTDAYLPLPYMNNLNMGYSTQGGSSPDYYTPSYYFRGNSLVLRPKPDASETAGLRIEYFQMPAQMVDSADLLTNQIAPIFRQVVEAYAVYMAKLSESLTAGTNTAAYAEKHFNGLFIQFKELSQKRSKNQTYVQPFNPE